MSASLQFGTTAKRRSGKVVDGRGSLGQCGNAPFSIPAHRTGRADLRHLALRLVSSQGTRRELWPQASSARLLSLLRLTIELSLKDPDHSWCLQAHRANHLHLAIFESTPEVRVLSSAGVTRLQRSYDPVRLPPEPSPTRDVEAATSLTTGLPRLPASPFRRAVPTTRRIERVRVSITSSLVQPSPNGRRVGIRIVTFEACSGFTHVTARRIAQLPKATFFTRLQPVRLPARAARQLPDQSTTLRVEFFLH